MCSTLKSMDAAELGGKGSSILELEEILHL